MAVSPRLICALVGGSVAVFATSAQAYTIKTTDSGAMVHWVEDDIAMRIDPALESYFSGLPVRESIVSSAEAWRDAAGVPDVLIQEGAPGEQGFEAGEEGSNGIYVLEQWPLAESSLAVTVATFESNSGRMVDADILVNASHPFTLLEEDPDAQPDEQFDLHSVMSHEVGHVLGLGESFDERMATMWPNIARGEIHQRDIHDDDATGVSEIYGQTIAAQTGSTGADTDATASPLGCGSASVTGRTSRQGLGVWAAVLFALGVVLLVARRSAQRGVWRRSAPALGMIVLFGAPFDPSVFQQDDKAERVQVLRTLALRRQAEEIRTPGLRAAADNQSAAVRLAAAAVLEKVGVREDATLASKLAGDSDSRVRAAGARALDALRTAPPSRTVTAKEAASRLATMMDGAVTVAAGKAALRGVEKRNGLFWTKYVVQDGDQEVTVEIPGGKLGKYTQVVSEQELPPNGAALVVAERENGTTTWAYHRDGLLYGGWLGEGAAIEWDR